jgi:hypothetical protein
VANPIGSALRRAYQALAGGPNDRYVREGACGCCGRWTTVGAGVDEVAVVHGEVEAFGELECRACADDRMHELEHITRGASEAEHARIVRDVPLAGVFRGTEHERAYRSWCERRGLAPLPPRRRRALSSSSDPVEVGSRA